MAPTGGKPNAAVGRAGHWRVPAPRRNLPPTALDPMRRRFALALAIAAALPGACRTAAPVVVPPTDKNIVDVLERGESARNMHVLWVTNRSSVPIVVTAVTLLTCENVDQPCDGPILMTRPIAPGHRVVVLRVRPKYESNSFSYDYTFAWRRADAPASP